MLTTGACCALLDDDVKRTLSDGLQVALGVLWLVAAVAKGRDPRAIRASVERLVDGPGWYVGVVARGLVPVELVLAAMLILRWRPDVAGVASAVLFLAFALLLGRAAIRAALAPAGAAPAPGGCGCFGTSAPQVEHDPRSGMRAVARNLALAALALAAAFGG